MGSLISRGTDFYGYVFGTIIIVGIVCNSIGANVFKEFDDLVAIFLTNASFLKLACFCSGCCYGMEWKLGLYNYRTERYEFPIQLVEGIVYFFLLLFLKINKKRIKEGYMMPIFLIIYSICRFIIQFFRDDQRALSFFHLISLFCVLLGFFLFIYIKKKMQDIETRKRTISELLGELGKLPERVTERVEEEYSVRKLKKWVKLAERVENIEEFLEFM